jgi:hypothetical protein
MGVFEGHFFIPKINIAHIITQDAMENIKQGAFPCAILTQQRLDFPRPHRKTHILSDMYPRELF